MNVWKVAVCENRHLETEFWGGYPGNECPAILRKCFWLVIAYVINARWLRLLTIIIIIERRDYGGVLTEDCEDTEQSSEKVSKRGGTPNQKLSDTAETIVQVQDSFWRTVQSSGSS